MNFLIKLLISALAVIVSAYFLKGVSVDDYWTAIVVAAVLAFLNAVVKPLMIILTIPITVLTLGIFLIVINGLMILFADYIVDGFEVDGFFWALMFSLILTIVNSVFEALAKEKERD